jgi:hypothetical protein
MHTNGHTKSVAKTVKHPRLGKLKVEFVDADQFQIIANNLDAAGLQGGVVSNMPFVTPTSRTLRITTGFYTKSGGRTWAITYAMVKIANYHFSKSYGPCKSGDWEGRVVRHNETEFVLTKPLAFTVV